MKADEVLSVILDKIESVAKAKTILADPIQMGETTVVPICKIGVGFGAGGSGDGDSKVPASGGGGFSIEPIAFLTVTGESVQLLPIKPDRMGSFAKAIPMAIEKMGDVVERSMNASKKKKEEE